MPSTRVRERDVDARMRRTERRPCLGAAHPAARACSPASLWSRRLLFALAVNLLTAGCRATLASYVLLYTPLSGRRL